MNKLALIVIGVYFSICASLSTAAIETLFMRGVTSLTVSSAVFTFPFGLYFSRGFIGEKYNLKQSILIGILIMLLSLLSFFIYVGVYSYTSIPNPTIQEVVYAPILLFMSTLLTMGVIIFPTAGISGAILCKLVRHYKKSANKSLNTDATR